MVRGIPIVLSHSRTCQISVAKLLELGEGSSQSHSSEEEEGGKRSTSTVVVVVVIGNKGSTYGIQVSVWSIATRESVASKQANKDSDIEYFAYVLQGSQASY